MKVVHLSNHLVHESDSETIHIACDFSRQKRVVLELGLFARNLDHGVWAPQALTCTEGRA